MVHAVPYLLVKQLAKLPRNRGIQTTTKLLGCAFLFALIYLALGVLVGQRWGPLAGLVVVAAAPACGYLTLRTAERLHDAGGLVHLRRSLRRAENLREVWADRERVVTLAHDLLVVPVPRGASRPDEADPG